MEIDFNPDTLTVQILITFNEIQLGGTQYAYFHPIFDFYCTREKATCKLVIKNTPVLIK